MRVMFTQAYQINLSVKLERAPKQSVKLTMKLLQREVVAKTWIECKFVAKALWKSELTIWYSCRENHY